MFAAYGSTYTLNLPLSTPAKVLPVSSTFKFVASSVAMGSKRTPAPLAEGGIYSDATLTVLNSKNIAKTEIRFKNVYPTSLGSLSYDIKASDVDYLQVQASFNYLHYDIIQISTT